MATSCYLFKDEHILTIGTNVNRQYLYAMFYLFLFNKSGCRFVTEQPNICDNIIIGFDIIVLQGDSYYNIVHVLCF